MELSSSLCWCLLLTLVVAVLSVSSQSRCYSGIENLRDYPLPSEENARYLQSFNQIIVPQLQFSCNGSVASWSAHMLVLTGINFIEILTHTVTFQVWRPGPDGQSYTLIGSNMLRFAGGDFINTITRIAGNNDTAFFTFTRSISQDEQIYFSAGDVVGWYIPIMTNSPPLSPLFRDAVSSDDGSVIVNMRFMNSSQQDCIVCNFTTNSQVFSSVVPLVSATTNRIRQSECEQICRVNMPATVTTLSTEATPTGTPSANTQSCNQQTTTVEIVSIIVAAVTLILHIIIIALCTTNLVIMKAIKREMKSRTEPISSGVRSPSAFQLKTLATAVQSNTPADYDAQKDDDEDSNQTGSKSLSFAPADSVKGSTDDLLRDKDDFLEEITISRP